MKNKHLLGITFATLAITSSILLATLPTSPLNVTAVTRNQVGTSTEYSASLVLRSTYNNDEKYFSYNDTTHIADVSAVPVEYTLSWVNGDSDHFSIFDGTHYLDLDTSANKFTESAEPVYWTMSTEGIGRTIEETTKYLYYNNSSPRVAPYIDKTGNASYAIAYFYTTAQMTSWRSRCSGTFAEACLEKIAYEVPEITLYTVSFNANGGTGTMASIEKAEGSSYTLPGNGFTAPNGKIFSGWSYEANGEKISTNSITINSNIILYALWEEVSTTITSPLTIEKSELASFADNGAANEKGHITITNTSSYGTTVVTELRIYKGKILTISSSEKTITSIQFTCTKSGTTKEGPGCFAAQSGYSYSDKVGTWIGSAASVTFTAESNQVRITQIVITFE